MRRLISPPQTKPVRETETGLRAAFTLLELMIVISIILILMALLAPALNAVFAKAREAQVRTEITGLANACDSFKGVHSHYPPSYIILYEEKNKWSAQSIRTIRRIWGSEFRFDVDRDFDGNGQFSGSHTLTGAECLVFFLGGPPRKIPGTGGQPDKWDLKGFSKSKTDPFKPGGKNRVKYFIDWEVGRLADIDGNGFPEYYDQFNEDVRPNDPSSGKPYIYVSTMRTGNYEITDIPGSGLKLIYWQSGTETVVNGNPAITNGTPWKDKAFQIISPGRDKQYGIGGIVNEAVGLKPPNNGASRYDEEDNMTNFSQSRLGN